MEATPTLRFSVVIPTFERREVVLRSVEALGSQVDGGPFEVVVVVDGSTDGSAAALRELQMPFPLSVLEQPNEGASAARNRGAAAARGELLLFLDDDMEADPALLAEHARSHREGVDVVFGHVPLHPDSPPGFLAESVGDWAEKRLRSLAGRGGKLAPTDLITGQVSLRRDVFLDLGGFDTNFTRGGTFGGEDFDLGLRLAAAGCRMVFNPTAISSQRYVVTPRQHLRNRHDAGGARVMVVRKHPGQAAALFDRRERLANRYFWRFLRRPLREIVLMLVAAGLQGRRMTHWFRRARDLEFFAGVRSAGGVPASRPVRVVCYHSISDLRGGGALEQYGVPPRRFRRQLRLLARHFRFVAPDEFRRYLTGGGVPRRAMLLTFDDCFQDLLDAALPVLEELRIPAVAFAPTALVGRTNEWGTRNGEPELALVDANGLHRLAESEVAIGSHARTHPGLDQLGPDELKQEIEGSIADLESLGLGRPSLLAYPYGRWNDRVKAAAAAAGLTGAFTTQQGLARPGGDPYEVPRIEIFRDDGRLRFAWKVVTGRPTKKPGGGGRRALR
jgi:peptidoglycan/xylan/chitin deacetylase (PgdA/CDA1 family)/GT2 family glycosyltransferase